MQVFDESTGGFTDDSVTTPSSREKYLQETIKAGDLVVLKSNPSRPLTVCDCQEGYIPDDIAELYDDIENWSGTVGLVWLDERGSIQHVEDVPIECVKRWN